MMILLLVLSLPVAYRYLKCLSSTSLCRRLSLASCGFSHTNLDIQTRCDVESAKAHRLRPLGQTPSVNPQEVSKVELAPGDVLSRRHAHSSELNSKHVEERNARRAIKLQAMLFERRRVRHALDLVRELAPNLPARNRSISRSMAPAAPGFQTSIYRYGLPPRL